VAILIDQNVLRDEAVFVDFFGKTAATTPGLAYFALRTGAPILPVFCDLAPRSTYHIRILAPVLIESSGDFDRDVLKITGFCTKMIEVEIRRKPSHWFWFHKRWNTRPREEEPSAPEARMSREENKGR
jgi:KDO2-lipid IV(A) lauroyltransferase